MHITSAPDTKKKLSILSQDSQYDLACACGTDKADRRHRSDNDQWVYPLTLADGGKSAIFKTLMSNVCSNDCGYCPLRAEKDPRRCTLEPEEISKTFLEYYRAKKVFGLFLSSGVIGSPDKTMERLNQTAKLLRKKERFRGYLHLKIIPGASDAAIEETLSLASAVSLNIEVPGEKNFEWLSKKKNYQNDIIHPLKYLSELTAKGSRYERVRQTTQFVVGAAKETDREIVRYTGALYSKLRLDRVYFSAYQRGLGSPQLPGETTDKSNGDLLMREHRLYQTDFLLRQYGFSVEDIPMDGEGQLSLVKDPKLHWAELHPDRFPIDINNAGRSELLKVPGIGPLTVKKIFEFRKNRLRIRSLNQLGIIAKGKKEDLMKSFVKI